MFDRLVHADWSISPKKRWMATAERRDDDWWMEGPHLVDGTVRLLDQEFASEGARSILLGFDFPIGLPKAYGRKTAFSGFREALPAFGSGSWLRFFEVAEAPYDIDIYRPFYPRRSVAGTSRRQLIDALGVASWDELMRECDRGSAGSRAACALFWTLGGNQVGKAAISGWQEIVRPALERGAGLWPFDGTLPELSAKSRIVIAETYPALAYGMVGASFAPGQSKRRQEDRKTKAAAILHWAEQQRIGMSVKTLHSLEIGFSASGHGEDQFDALLGLLKMIEVADGRQTEGRGSDVEWEGWMLGRVSPSSYRSY